MLVSLFCRSLRCSAAQQHACTIVYSHHLQCAGLDLLNQYGIADCSYDLTPQQLYEKIKDVDALIVRSATKVGMYILSEAAVIPTTQHACAMLPSEHSLLGWEYGHWTDSTWHADLQSLLV